MKERERETKRRERERERMCLCGKIKQVLIVVSLYLFSLEDLKRIRYQEGNVFVLS